MSHIFVSYAHSDGDFVILLKGELEKAGFEVWVDTERLRAGEDWRQGIDRAIQSSLALVAVLSPDAVASTYVTYEWAYALGLGVAVLPLLLKPTTVHPRLEFLQYLDFSHRVVRPWERLIADLEKIHEDRAALSQKAALDDFSHSPARAIPPGQDHRLAGQVRQQLSELRDGKHEAARALLEAGQTVQPALLDALLDSDREIQNSAAYVFEQMGGDGVLFLLEALHDNHHSLARLAAIRGLGILEITEAVPEILRALRDEDTAVRVVAQQALQQIGRAATPELLGALSDLHVETRMDAAWALGEIKDTSVIDQLLDSLYDPDNGVRIAVADALGEIGGKTAVEGLLHVLDDADCRVQYAAVLALGRIGNPAAVPRLLDLLNSDDDSLRLLTTAVLGDIGDSSAIPPLVARIQDDQEEEDIRTMAAESLGAIGDAAAVPVLVASLEMSSVEISSMAALALGKIKDTTALLPLVTILGNHSSDRRCAAARALGEIGSAAAVPHLIDLLADRNNSQKGERVCNVAASALELIGTLEALEAIDEWRRRK